MPEAKAGDITSEVVFRVEAVEIPGMSFATRFSRSKDFESKVKYAEKE